MIAAIPQLLATTPTRLPTKFATQISQPVSLNKKFWQQQQQQQQKKLHSTN
jgi:hypothetical protein